MLAGAVPFIEGEVAALVGVVGGIHPLVAAIAAATGNFLFVVVVVLVTSRARTALVSRDRVGVDHMAGASGTSSARAGEGGVATARGPAPRKPESKGRRRFTRWLVRYGVPGASILGPFAIPTQFMSAILVAGGTSRAWVLLWQAVAIVIWTTVATVSSWAALTFIVGV